MLLSNAQISPKVQLLAILMGACLCLEDGSSDVPASPCDAPRAMVSYPACQSCHHEKDDCSHNISFQTLEIINFKKPYT